MSGYSQQEAGQGSKQVRSVEAITIRHNINLETVWANVRLQLTSPNGNLE